jgi:DNA-binding XRE family transcriptional regulator
MVRKWADVSAGRRAKPGAAEAIARHRQRLEAEIDAHDLRLQELRRACGKTQQEVATALGTPQGAVSRLEGQEDLYLSTLRRYIEALGGRLEMRAVFEDASVNFAELVDEPAAVPAGSR